MKKNKLFVLPLIAFLASCGGGASQNNGGSGESQPSSPYKTEVPAGGEVIPYEEPASGGEEGGQGGQGGEGGEGGEGGQAQPTQYEKTLMQAIGGVIGSFYSSSCEGNLSFSYVVNETVPVDQTSGLYVTANESLSGNLHFVFAGSDGANISRYVRLDLQNFTLMANVNYAGMPFSASIVNLNVSMFYVAFKEGAPKLCIDLSDPSVTNNLNGLINTANGIYNTIVGMIGAPEEPFDFSKLYEAVPLIAKKHYLSPRDLAMFIDDSEIKSALSGEDPLGALMSLGISSLAKEIGGVDFEQLLRTMPFRPNIYTYKDATGAVNRIAVSAELDKDDLGVPDVIGQSKHTIYDSETGEIIGSELVGGVKVESLNLGASAVVGTTKGTTNMMALEEVHVKAGFACEYGTAAAVMDCSLAYNEQAHFSYPSETELAAYDSNILEVVMALYNQFSDLFPQSSSGQEVITQEPIPEPEPIPEEVR